MAAEIPGENGGAWRGVTGFNEAAANGRGNHHGRPQEGPGGAASMRPRRMAAEITGDDGRGRMIGMLQ